MYNNRKHGNKGFTLAELLIALAILGVIAVFAIPKVLSAQQNQQKKSTLREVAATLSEVSYRARVYKSITDFTQSWNYIASNVNAVKSCSTDAASQGCWTQPANGNALPANLPGFTLHNGATLVKWSEITFAGKDYVGYLVDWDGPKGTNLAGDDQLCLTVTLNNGKVDNMLAHTTYCPPAANSTMYESIFSAN